MKHYFFLCLAFFFVVDVTSHLFHNNTATEDISEAQTFEDEYMAKYQALQATPPSPCGYPAPTSEQIRAMGEQERLQINDSVVSTLWNTVLCTISKRLCDRTVTIPVYVHNVHAQDGTGKVTEENIRSMIDVANRQFESTGFRFRLRKINFVANTDWYASERASSVEQEMFRNLKVGKRDTMNVYLKLAYLPGYAFCGYAYMAQDARVVGVSDGIVINPSCTNDDKTFSHEIGHYLNLMHTFDGGCDPGDLVDDTPAESHYVGRIPGCPSNFTDSCPDQPGLDPMDNIMDYSPTGCTDRFTDGQIQRMHRAWRQYRARFLRAY